MTIVDLVFAATIVILAAAVIGAGVIIANFLSGRSALKRRADSPGRWH